MHLGGWAFTFKEVANVKKKIAVHCNTKEEWESVRKKADNSGVGKWGRQHEIDVSQGDAICLYPEAGGWDFVKAAIRNDCTVLTAQEYLNEGGKDVSEFKVGDRVEVILGHGDAKIGMKGNIFDLNPKGNDDGYVAIDFDERVNFSTDIIPSKIGHGYYVNPKSLKIIGKTQITKENNMNKNISDVFDKTKEALLVEKHLGNQIGTNFIDGLILADKKTEVLAEAKRLEKEEKEGK
jgi:hypothetical protein